MASGALPWTLQTLLNELYQNQAPLPVPRRAVEPIITSLLSSPKTSLRLANKTLEKTPSSLVKTLKACALDAQHKTQEAKSTIRQVLADPKGLGEAGCLSLLVHLCAKFDMMDKLCEAGEAALTAHPMRKDLFVAVMSLFLQAGDFKKVQQIALRVYKSFHLPSDPSTPDRRWLEAAVQAMLMQCRKISDPQSAERSLLLALAERNLQSLPQPKSVDEFHLRSQHFALKGPKEELEWFKRPEVQEVAGKDLGTELARREVVSKHGTREDKLALAQHCLKNLDDKNWATISMSIALAMQLGEQDLLDQITDRLQELAKDKELGRERGYALGLLLPHKTQREESVGPALRLYGGPLELVVSFYNLFSSKYSTWSDLEPFLPLLQSSQLSALADQLKPKSGENAQALQTRINKERILLSFRHLHKLGDQDIDWTAEADRHLEAYFAALPLGKELPLTDLQFADEYAMLAAECWLNVWRKSNDSTLLLSCAALLDYAVQRSPYRYQIRLLLIRVYRLLGLPLRALEQFRLLGAKQIQLDTLAHYAVDRSSTWALISSPVPKKAVTAVESPYKDQMSRMAGWYQLGLAETAESITKVYRKGVWQKTAEYHELYDRLASSAARANLQINIAKLAALGDPALPDKDQDLSRLESLVRMGHLSDNSDESLLPLSVRQVSEMGPKVSSIWIDTMLKASIVTSKLQDPSCRDLPSDDLKESITQQHPQAFTVAEREWLGLLDTCRQCKADSTTALDAPSITNFFTNRLTEVDALPKAGVWSWQTVQAAAAASEALTFLQGFIDASSRSKPANPDFVRSLKKIMSENVRPTFNDLVTRVSTQAAEPTLTESALAKRAEIDWNDFSSAARAEWRAGCKEIAARMKKLA